MKLHLLTLNFPKVEALKIWSHTSYKEMSVDCIELVEADPSLALPYKVAM